MSLPEFGVRKSVVANLVMFAIIGAGLIFGTSLRKEFFPEIDADRVSVAAPYPGASPDEVESSLTVKIEDQLADLPEIDEITSSSVEGAAGVTLKFKEGTNIDVAVADVKREIDALQDLPERSERITIQKIEPKLPAIVVSIFGDGDEREMKSAIERVRDDLRSLPGMGEIETSGVRTDEIRVELRPEAMLEHALSLPEVSRRINAAMAEQPGGTVRSETVNTAVRTMGIEEQAEEVGAIVVKAGDDGRPIRLRDVATVTRGFVDIDLMERLNGKPAVSATIYGGSDEDIVDIANLVKAYVAGLRGEEFTPTLSERLGMIMRRPGDEGPVSPRMEAYDLGLARSLTPLPGDVTTTTDLARFVVGRLDLLTRNAVYGGVLVFLVLVLLLNWRVSFWVALGLIISLLGTLAVMAWADVTLNLLTMFGLIIVVGILVDDAIVVAENITARHEAGEDSDVAAIRGAEQVAWPVLATVLTTICAFLPLGIISGQFGDFLRVLPIVVACALSVSLIESLFILPAHMAHSLRNADRREEKRTRLGRLEARFDRWRDGLFTRFLTPNYLKLLKLAVRVRYLSITASLSLIVVSAGLVAGGVVGFIFFEVEDAETVNASITMPIGTPASKTDEYVKRIERAALNQPEVSSAWGLVGAQADLNNEGGDRAQSHLGQVIMELVAVENRDRGSEEIIDAIRKELGPLTGVKSFRIEGFSGGPGGASITLTLVADSESILTSAVAEVETLLEGLEDAIEISNNSDAGQREIQFELRPGASELGFTQASLGEQIRGAIFGLEAYTFAGKREDVDVRVLLPERERRSLAAIENMYVFTPDGQPVALSEVARVVEGRTYATIHRFDRRRAITVSSEVAAGGNPEAIMTQVRPQLREIEAKYPGLRILERGRQKEVADSFATLPIGMAAAAGLIYVILAWLFQSYAQPLVVMTAIPFATIGMIVGHWVTGYNLTFLSLIGFVALTGIVVNDSLILMEFYNLKRREGLTVYDAVIEAGRARLRAIILTTVTTVLGLLPLMLEQSLQARFLIPMALTIAFGLMSATGIVLIVLPCLLVILDDAKSFLKLAWEGEIEAEPASPLHPGSPEAPSDTASATESK